MAKLIYIPTEEEKIMLNEICAKVIDAISKETDGDIGKMALIVDTLYNGFQDSVKKIGELKK